MDRIVKCKKKLMVLETVKNILSFCISGLGGILIGNVLADYFSPKLFNSTIQFWVAIIIIIVFTAYHVINYLHYRTDMALISWYDIAILNKRIRKTYEDIELLRKTYADDDNEQETKGEEG